VNTDQTEHCSPSCRCGEPLGRREFLKLAGLGAAAVTAVPTGAMAGPFGRADFEKLVPADKRLRQEWVQSLFARGTRTVYRGTDLEKIGMPVGGICTGQIYLGGEGRLWHWDLFNKHVGTGAEHYAKPMQPASPLEQGFAVRVTAGGRTQVRPLDRTGFAEVSFCGEYPIGFVDYHDDASPVAVSLEAFSPFIPLDADDSNLPATVMRFTLTNTGGAPVEAQLAGWLENAVCLDSALTGEGVRRNRWRRRPNSSFLECSAEPAPPPAVPARPDVVFEDFEKETYEGWTVAGTAFGPGPVEKAKIPGYQGDVGGEGERVVNSHNTRNSEDVGAGDNHTGRLTSRAFKVERKFVSFYIGGGNNPGQTCLNLLVDGKVARTATGRNDNRMRRDCFDVSELEGHTAQLEIVDEKQGGWGNVGVDHIVFTDSPSTAVPLDKRADFGTMGLALLDAKPDDAAILSLPAGNLAEEVFPVEQPTSTDAEATRPFGQKLVSAVTRKLALKPGESATVTFVLTWHFPNLQLDPVRGSSGRHYAKRFASAATVADYIADNFDSLAGQTRLWHETWYDSTLPYWFLDRTFANASILASSTCHWFDDGRFYGWEGVGCCAGTCTHVWHYAHAVARLFPQLERDLRERTDFGLAFDPGTGVIRFRGEGAGLAVDGQAGCILRSYREHQMSADDAFLKRNWPKIRRALECLIEKDADGDGIIEGGQHNTLDADWYGPVAWLSGLYLAALRAGEEMAKEVGDTEFAARARGISDAGTRKLVETLWGGEYFVNQPDPEHPEAINSGTGCEIDQVFGQSWAFQVGLGRVLPEDQTRTALASLWRYNFAPDAGPYREVNKPGRWYAMPGEAGLLMCTFPRPDWDYTKASGKGAEWAAGYFNECMNGFEYQAAGHMLWEGLVQEGLAVTRAVHDRYHASRRNPWNEVECGDHYARSMASYGVFLAACGYEHHGPEGHLGFAPRLTPEDFRAPFTTAEGWGTYSQKRAGGDQKAEVAVKWGRVRLKTLAFRAPDEKQVKAAQAHLDGQERGCTFAQDGDRVLVTLAREVVVAAGQALGVALSG